jgi:hypothetical protein
VKELVARQDALEVGQRGPSASARFFATTRSSGALIQPSRAAASDAPSRSLRTGSREGVLGWCRPQPTNAFITLGVPKAAPTFAMKSVALSAPVPNATLAG